MNPSDAQNAVTIAVITSLTGFFVVIVYYVWYALALSKLFPKLGGESWRGWVPVLNEMEILVRGGVPGWSVVYYFIPIVSLYGLYLKATAVHRINEQFGRGIGMTVLGVLLPPVWASILGWGRTPAVAGVGHKRVESMLGNSDAATPSAGTGPLAGQPTAFSPPPFTPASASDASGYALPTPPAPRAAPAAPFAAPVAPPVAPAPAAAPPAPSASSTAPPAPAAPAATTVSAPPAAPTAAADAGQIQNPWAPQAPAQASVPPVAAAPIAAPPVAPAAPVVDAAPPAPIVSTPPIIAEAPVVPADPPVIPVEPAPVDETFVKPAPVDPAPVEAPPVEPAAAAPAPVDPVFVEPVPTAAAPAAAEPTAPDLTTPPEPVEPEPVAPAPPVVAPVLVTAAAASVPEDDDDDELDRTVVVDRRPVVPWTLHTDDGFSVALTGSAVVLGRNPSSTETGVQAVAVPDTTRTLSKTHARLDLADGEWTVTDLNSTNGVIVVGTDDAENLIAVGEATPLTARFVLGKVGMRLSFGSEPSA